MRLMQRLRFFCFRINNYCRRNQVLVLGDSHAMVFKHKNMRTYFPEVFFNVVSVGGATVSGLTNPNSKTQAFPIFQSALGKTKAKTVVVLLGEVDTGFVIWRQSEKYGNNVERVLLQAILKYQNFIMSIVAKNDVICVSAPLPTIKDGQYMGKVANERKSVKATLSERVSLTIRFNSLIEEFCKENGVDYLNLDSHILSEEGVVKKDYLNSDPGDHHFNKSAYSELICRQLKSVRIPY